MIRVNGIMMAVAVEVHSIGAGVKVVCSDYVTACRIRPDAQIIVSVEIIPGDDGVNALIERHPGLAVSDRGTGNRPGRRERLEGNAAISRDHIATYIAAAAVRVAS